MSSEDDENVLPRAGADEDEEDDDVIARELPRAMQRLQLNRSRFLTRLRPRRANRKSSSSGAGRVRSVAFKGVRLEREQPSSTVRLWRKARSGATSPETPHRGRAQREASAQQSAQRCLETRLRLRAPQQVRTRAASL
jgi:hypothetical protein